MALCRCSADGTEWAATVNNLVNHRRGCPQCGIVRRSGRRRAPAASRESQINALANISFVRWQTSYRNIYSKAICRCELDGTEWAASVGNLVNNRNGCPVCAGTFKRTSAERILQINALPNIRFVKWASEYANNTSKAVCRCLLHGEEWTSRVYHLLIGRGCPRCAKTGFNPAKPATLYLLRSDCGSMVKIGISNNHEQRHAQLRRRTPFDWNCIELLHGDGEAIADMEKELHSITEQATFSQPFDGYTEWRKWDPRLLKWVDRYRTQLARYNKAP